MSMHRALVIAAVAVGVGISGCGGGAPSPRGTTLSSLRDAMQWVRGGHGSQPRALDPLPAIEALPGATRAELTRQIGAPRTCGYPIEAPCARPGELLWTFYRGHAADEAAGPVLVVDFDPSGTVTAARWRRGEVEAPPEPIAPATSGGEAIASTERTPPDQAAPASDATNAAAEPAAAPQPAPEALTEQPAEVTPISDTSATPAE